MTFPWIASYGDSLKIADNSGNTYPPCFCALSEKQKKEIRLNLLALEKIKPIFAFLGVIEQPAR